MPLLTIFTTPKPFMDDHIAIIQRNALRSWLQLDEQVEVLLIGSETGMPEIARELGIRHIPDVARNDSGTPLVSSIFDLAHRHGTAPLLVYINTDIILLPEFINAVRLAGSLSKDFLLMGQRWDLDVPSPLDLSPGWDQRLCQQLDQNGRLHPPAGSDYFLYRRGSFTDIPPFAIGRAGWDNWMIYHARRSHWDVIDATADVTVIHQNHDYRHLPGGQPHYRLPETDENIRLAGGRAMTRFTLLDANRRLVDGRLRPQRVNGGTFRRAVEAFPLLAWNDPLLAERLTAWFNCLQARTERKRN